MHAVLRELRFVGVAAVLAVGWVAIGHAVAPDASPEPDRKGGVVKQKEFLASLKAQREHAESKRERAEFVRNWYRWGAAGGVVLVIAFTLLRTAAPGIGNEESGDKQARRRTPTGGLSRSAIATMIAALAIIVALIAVLAAAVS